MTLMLISDEREIRFGFQTQETRLVMYVTIVMPKYFEYLYKNITSIMKRISIDLDETLMSNSSQL